MSRDQLARAEISFGVQTKAGAPPRMLVRARLYRGVREVGGEPPVDAVIDTVASLPSIAAEGIVDVTLMLPIESVGIPADPSAPVAATSGRTVKGRIDRRVAPRACAGTAREGEVCVPVGAAWMGNPLYRTGRESGPSIERLVVVSPFFLDGREATVADFRPSGVASTVDPFRSDATQGPCTFTDARGANENLPLNCVSWEAASRFCAARGARLPTEAELEFVAGGRASQPFPWGMDEPGCADAVVSRVSPTPDENGYVAANAACAGLGVGPAPVAQGRRDALSLPGEALRDLAGNMAEWASDDAEELGGACWSAGFSVDPVCRTSSKAKARVARGVRGPTFDRRCGRRAGTSEAARVSATPRSVSVVLVMEAVDRRFMRLPSAQRRDRERAGGGIVGEVASKAGSSSGSGRVLDTSLIQGSRTPRVDAKIRRISSTHRLACLLQVQRHAAHATAGTAEAFAGDCMLTRSHDSFPRRASIALHVALGIVVAACTQSTTGTGPVPFVPGTCEIEGEYCVYPSQFDEGHGSGRTWCYSPYPEVRSVFHEETNGVRVECADLGFPVVCSNCTGRDFYYPEGKVCPPCESSSSSSTSGSTSGGPPPCNYSECLQTCYEAGGTYCGDVCKCD